MAVLPFGEIKTEFRKNAKAVSILKSQLNTFFLRFLQMYKVMELAAMNAYETTYFNMTGEQMNPVIPFINQHKH